MKPLILAFLLATAAPAQAQQLSQPKVIKLHNKATGAHLGSITISNGRAYYRNKDGEHYATVVRNPDGTTTAFDPSGSIIPWQQEK